MAASLWRIEGFDLPLVETDSLARFSGPIPKELTPLVEMRTYAAVQFTLDALTGRAYQAGEECYMGTIVRWGPQMACQDNTDEKCGRVRTLCLVGPMLVA